MFPIIFAASATPALSGRFFLATFVLVASARVAPDFSLFSETALSVFASAPVWLLSDYALGILGVLAVFEISAGKVKELRDLRYNIDYYLKPVGAFFLTQGLFHPDLLGASDAVHGVILSGLDWLPGLIAGFLTWLFISTRNKLCSLWLEADSEDELGLMTLISWLTDFASTFWILLLLIFPIIAFILLGGVLLVVFMLRARQRTLEKRFTVNCKHCGVGHSTAAVNCPSCKAFNPAPKKLSLLGFAAKSNIVTDLSKHRLDLLQWRRCPACAAKLPKRAVSQHCRLCGTQTFLNTESAERYLESVWQRMPRILVVSAVISAIPILGLVAGVIYYQLSVIAGLKQYLPAGEVMLGRWVIRVLSFFLLWIQVIPFVGIIAIPIMCTLNYLFYRRKFAESVERKLSYNREIQA